MVDEHRIAELASEIGEDDMGIVFGLFLSEAERTIDAIATGLGDDAHARATHFLRSGALNIGFTGLAAAADTAAAAAAGDRAGTASVLSDCLRRSVASLDFPVAAA